MTAFNKKPGPPKGGRGPADLAAEVIDKDRCAVCGACVGHCPYFVHEEGRVVVRDRCSLGQGRCYEFCPMAGARTGFDGDLGSYTDIFIARATRPDVRKKAQYGGVVTTLVGEALKQGLVDEAVLTSGDPENAPRGVRVRTRQEAIDAAGSRYSASGAVAVLNQALAEPGKSPLGLVGVPCQIKAAAAMKSASGPNLAFDPQRIRLLIGLFCTWALDFRRLDRYLRVMLFGERPFHYDIPAPPAEVFKVATGDGLKAFPLCEVRPLQLGACKFCDDMTSTRADVSVGAVEGLDGWNTVIVRSETGAGLVEAAQKKKLLKVDRLPADDLEHLKESAAGKKERSIVNWSAEGQK